MFAANYYYIVADIGDKRYFLDKDANFTHDLKTVMRFASHNLAQQYIEKHKLSHITTRIVGIKEPCING